MKAFLFAVGLILIFSAPVSLVWADDEDDFECTLSQEAIEPSFIPEHEMIKPGTYKIERSKEGQGITEWAEMLTGFKVKLTVGGCTHYGVIYEFTDISQEFSSGKDTLSLVASLIANTPVKENKKKQADYLAAKIMENLSLKADEYGVIWVPCDDASCYIDTKAIETEGKVDFTYDFPL